VQFEITEQTRSAVSDWIKQAKLKSDNYLFPSRIHDSPHITTWQYARIVQKWVASVGLNPADYGTHSFRRTKASLIYRQTKNLRAVQLLLGHTKLESTVRYLGVEVDDALEMAEHGGLILSRCGRPLAVTFLCPFLNHRALLVVSNNN
jgi:integrase